MMATETRELLANYHALRVYDLARIMRYGDMAANRRDRELNRLIGALIHAGVDGCMGRTLQRQLG